MGNQMRVVLNGQDAVLDAAAEDTLLEVLRRQQLHGCRESCGQGVCGTCTVLVDGHSVTSCLLLAQLVDGSDIVTIEGLGQPGHLNVVQEAFVREAAFQCGFCTPGMIVSATELLRENADPTEREIAEHLSGNLCRCGAYPEILRAVRLAATMLQDGDGSL